MNQEKRKYEKPKIMAVNQMAVSLGYSEAGSCATGGSAGGACAGGGSCGGACGTGTSPNGGGGS